MRVAENGGGTGAPRRRWRVVGRWLGAGVLALAVAGCSVVGLAYQQLPTVLMWWLDSLWHLQGDQREGVEEALRRWYA